MTAIPRITCCWTCTWPPTSRSSTVRSGTELWFRWGPPSLQLLQVWCLVPSQTERNSVCCLCVQYFSPYVSADMTKMAQAFNTTVAALEDELTQLILEGLVNARIDSHSKVKLIRARAAFDWTLPGAHCSVLTDPVCQRRGPAEHHLWEVPPHGQRVSETGQGHDSACCGAEEPDPCQGRRQRTPTLPLTHAGGGTALCRMRRSTSLD